MKPPKLFTAIVILMGSVVMSASAVSVAFQVIQRDRADVSVNENTYLIEEGLFDFFFSRGIIASNSPAAVSPAESEDFVVFQQSMGEADKGGATYFIKVIEKFKEYESSNPGGKLLSNLEYVQWTLISLETGTDVAVKKSVPPLIQNQKNVEKGLVAFSASVAKDIVNAIIDWEGRVK